MSHLEEDSNSSPVIEEMGITGGNHTTKRRRSKSNSWRIRQRQLDSQKFNIQNLPEDIALRITSKLTLKEAAQMCVLSSTWRQACVFHPNLCFGIQTVLGSRANAELIFSVFTDQRKRILATNKFIERVDAILKNHCTTQVNTFAIEFRLSTEHASHIDRWVSFAIASKARVVVLDLPHTNLSGLDDNYDFPFQLFDGQSGSHLHALRLRHVTLGPPPEFCGFANLKMLDLECCTASQDLQHLVSKCCVLEWLRIRSCFLRLPSRSSLCVQEALYRLRYLCVQSCDFREIEFHAPNLMTFEYEGSRTLINLSGCLKLKTATIRLEKNKTLQYVLTWIPCILPQVDTPCVELRIYSKIYFCPLCTFCTILFSIPYLVASLPLNLFQMSGFTHPPIKFAQLRHLTVDISSCRDPNSVLQLACLLEAAPLLEDLYFDMFGYDSTEYGDLDDIMDLPHYHLKTVCIDGFYGTDGQVGLAKYILKNALALKHLIVKPKLKLYKGLESATSTVSEERYGRQVANIKLVPLDTNSVLTIL